MKRISGSVWSLIYFNGTMEIVHKLQTEALQMSRNLLLSPAYKMQSQGLNSDLSKLLLLFTVVTLDFKVMVLKPSPELTDK